MLHSNCSWRRFRHLPLLYAAVVVKELLSYVESRSPPNMAEAPLVPIFVSIIAFEAA